MERDNRFDYPGSPATYVMFRDEISTPEAIVNITYGYLGSAAGFAPDVLFLGGDFAAGGLLGLFTQADSPEDKLNIKKGIDWWKNNQ